jgi:DNA-binding protein HU-beta
VVEMNKNDFVNLISDKLGKTKKDVNLIIDNFLEEIITGLQNNEKIALTNFGTFQKSDVKKTDIYSPYDGKLLKGVTHTRVYFKSSSYLKSKLNK